MTNGRRATVLLVTHLYHSGKYQELQRVAGTLNGCSSCSLARSDNGWHFGVLEMLGTEAAESARSVLSESQEWGLSGQYLGECQSDEQSGPLSDSHVQPPNEHTAPEPRPEPKVERRLSAESARGSDKDARHGSAAPAPAVPESTVVAAAKLGLMDSLGNEAALVQKVKNVTFEMLAEHFESGLKEAAANLGLSPTSLKRACRKLGIRKWPRRELKRKADAECRSSSAQYAACQPQTEPSGA
ncbi:hypothetical protein WJX73_003466 [Symbiochloris irregularis]|uniref:RWP-RK domain-containing protein n=1 Tax=Symbiochloris irregularis TaxID=706552 RepID=A0AAW1P3T8_9CHLO